MAWALQITRLKYAVSLCYLSKKSIDTLFFENTLPWKEEKNLAERSFDLRTSGLWAQHASTAPLCFVDNAVVASNIN